jgi:hypothetical protein
MIRISAAVATLAGMPVPAPPQAPSLAGKNVTMIIGSASGGGYDLWGRVVARHIGKHLPGKPTVVPQNLAGSRRLERRQSHLQRRAQGRHDDGHHRERRGSPTRRRRSTAGSAM